MKVLLIDDREIMELKDDGNAVMEALKDHYFHPCGWCGNVCFVGEGNTLMRHANIARIRKNNWWATLRRGENMKPGLSNSS